MAAPAVPQLTGHNVAELATVDAQSVPLHTAAKSPTRIILNACEDGKNFASMIRRKSPLFENLELKTCSCSGWPRPYDAGILDRLCKRVKYLNLAYGLQITASTLSGTLHLGL